MTGRVLGADPDALQRVAALLRSAARELSIRPDWSPDRVAAGGRREWSGPDAEQLLDALRSVQALRRHAADGLAACSTALERAVLEQRRASLALPSVAVPVDRPGGGGRLVQRIGPPDAAVVVVVVPGVGTDRGDRVRLRGDALRLWRDLADRVDDPRGLAVVSWLGYDPPDSLIGALDVGPAEDGARRLVGEVARLRGAGAATVVVVGHSYGGVVAGRAAARGMAADAVVQLGAPGSGAPGATSAITGRGVGLRAVRAPGDPIGFVADRMPGRYGEDPVGRVPGLPMSRSGHSAYLDDDVLLDALADLVLGYRRSP